MVNDIVAMLSEGSVAVYVTEVEPIGKESPGLWDDVSV